jgi:hypothetical protein
MLGLARTCEYAATEHLTFPLGNANVTRHWWLWLVYLTIFIVAGALHCVWFVATHDPAIGSRFGAVLTALGVVVTAQPFFRTGFKDAVDRQMPEGLVEAVSPPIVGHPLVGHSPAHLLKQQREAHKVARPGVMHDVVAERVIGVALIFFGTLAHGYGDLPLKWLGYAAN